MIQQMWNEEKQHLDTVERLAAKHNTPISWFTASFSVAAYALGIEFCGIFEKCPFLRSQQCTSWKTRCNGLHGCC